MVGAGDYDVEIRFRGRLSYYVACVEQQTSYNLSIG
jgi:hypothetical protein